MHVYDRRTDAVLHTYETRRRIASGHARFLLVVRRNLEHDGLANFDAEVTGERNPCAGFPVGCGVVVCRD